LFGVGRTNRKLGGARSQAKNTEKGEREEKLGFSIANLEKVWEQGPSVEKGPGGRGWGDEAKARTIRFRWGEGCFRVSTRKTFTTQGSKTQKRGL